MEEMASLYPSVAMMAGSMFVALYLIMRKDSKHFNKVVTDLAEIKDELSTKVESELGRIEQSLLDLRKELKEQRSEEK